MVHGDIVVWPPFCGAEYLGFITFGRVLICSRLVHSEHEAHVNEETGFRWFGRG